MVAASTVRLALAAAAFLGVASAHAAVVEYDFTGQITAQDTSGPLAPLLNPVPLGANPLSGFVRFDASTADTTPGNWSLPGAVLHIAYAGGNVDAVGAVASVSVNQDAFVFTFQIPAAQFLPLSITSATVGIGFQTFTNGYFSLTSLPTTVPPDDHTVGFSYAANGQGYGASTDTATTFTASVINPVPEPASVTVLLLGAVWAGAAARRRQAG
ncbi:MAG TPA: PEP-CTERM sorting domain-containing protein [Acetobacteraceae bacterium]